MADIHLYTYPLPIHNITASTELVKEMHLCDLILSNIVKTTLVLFDWFYY